jgi:hypothetical protein
MKSWLSKILIVLVIVAAGLILVARHHVLNSAELDRAIKREIPIGSEKTTVAAFIQKRHPVAYDDYGLELKARLDGLAENLVYQKDIVLTFELSPEGKLVSYSKREHLTFF